MIKLTKKPKYVTKGQWCVNSNNGYVKMQTSYLHIYGYGPDTANFITANSKKLDEFAKEWQLDGGQAPGNCKETTYTLYAENQDYWLHPMFAFTHCFNRGKESLLAILKDIGYDQFKPPVTELVEDVYVEPTDAPSNVSTLATIQNSNAQLALYTDGKIDFDYIKNITEFVGGQEADDIRQAFGKLIAQELKHLVRQRA
jgi:hypothetical protein